MKVREMIEVLKGLPQETDVLLARDSEGNGFHHLPKNFYSDGYVTKDEFDEFYIESYMQEECLEDLRMEYEEYPDEFPEIIPVVVIFP